MSKNFQRRKENFTCEKCGFAVVGNGYTNHCPKCLWSKHVDVHPGDRAEACGGLMEPVGVEGSALPYTLVHRCITCGETRRNQCSPNDDMSKVATLAKESHRR